MYRLSEKGLMKRALDGGINCTDHPFSYTLEGRAAKRNIEQDRAGRRVYRDRTVHAASKERSTIAVVQVLLCGYGPHLSEEGTVDEIGRRGLYPLSRRIYCGKNNQRFEGTATTAVRGLHCVVVSSQILVPVHVRWVLYLKRGHERTTMDEVDPKSFCPS